jgi:hypothetical protein
MDADCSDFTTVASVAAVHSSRGQAISRQQPQHMSGTTMIVVRMASGVRKHFHIRATEWVMLFPSVMLGAGMLYQHDMFTKSPSFRIVARWAEEPTWALLVLICALLRLSALAVNGTFQGFGVSPHMRLIASFAGAAFWSQFSLGFLIAYLTGVGSWDAPVAYSTFCFMEILNITRAWADVTARRR